MRKTENGKGKGKGKRKGVDVTVKSDGSGEATGVKFEAAWLTKINPLLGEIPIVGSIPKGEKTERTTLWWWPRLRQMAEIIKDGSKGRFPTISSVVRASIYIGMMILKEIHDKGIDVYGKAFFEYIGKMERVFMQADVVEMFIGYVERLHKQVDLGNLLNETATEMITQSLDKLPDECKKVAERRLQGIYNSKGMVLDINEARERRGRKEESGKEVDVPDEFIFDELDEIYEKAKAIERKEENG